MGNNCQLTLMDGYQYITHDQWKNITGLTPNQNVEWTATVETGLIEQTSGNPIYSVRVNTVE